MARFIKSKIDEIGLAPDVFYFRGTQKSDKTYLDLIDFDSENFSEKSVKDIVSLKKYSQTLSTSWLNIVGLHDTEVMKKLAETFELNHVLMSDVLNPNLRPKIFEYDNCFYISLKMLKYKPNTETVTSENLVLVLKDRILISFQESKGDVFEPVRERLRNNKKKIRTAGPDFLIFSLIDIVIDNYNYIISRTGELIENIDEMILFEHHNNVLENIKFYKREVIYLQKVVNPCKEIVMQTAKLDSEFFTENMKIHLSELKENITQAGDALEIYRDMLNDQISVYQSVMSAKLNDVMKFLTVFSAIFIPLTFIVGVYGTNFDNLPEIHFKYGYFVMWAVMIGLVITMILFFKNKKWL